VGLANIEEQSYRLELARERPREHERKDAESYINHAYARRFGEH
jgi:hypothetical protein